MESEEIFVSSGREWGLTDTSELSDSHDDMISFIRLRMYQIRPRSRNYIIKM